MSSRTIFLEGPRERADVVGRKIARSFQTELQIKRFSDYNDDDSVMEDIGDSVPFLLFFLLLPFLFIFLFYGTISLVFFSSSLVSPLAKRSEERKR